MGLGYIEVSQDKYSYMIQKDSSPSESRLNENYILLYVKYKSHSELFYCNKNFNLPGDNRFTNDNTVIQKTNCLHEIKSKYKDL